LVEATRLVGCPLLILIANMLSAATWPQAVIDAKGFPGADRHLRTSIDYGTVQALWMQERHGEKLVRTGKKARSLVWKLNA